MSEGINKVHIRGNAGRDAELRYTAGGAANANFSVAVSRWVRDSKEPGRGTEYTDWINVVAWGELAENSSGAVLKGEPVEVWGRLSTRSWDNDQGVKQYRTEVVANRIVAASGEVPSRAAPARAARPQPAAPPKAEDDDDGGDYYDTATGERVPASRVTREGRDPDDLPFE